VAERVIDGRSMLGILGTLPTTPPNLLRITLPSVQLVAVVAPDHPLAKVKGRIGKAPAAANPAGAVGPQRAHRPPGFSVHSRLTWRMSDLGTKHALLRAGMGWGNMPLHVVKDDLATGAWSASAPSTIATGAELPIQCVYKPDHPAGPALSWWLDSLAALTALSPISPAQA
jgi:DNA-binding transcriptional LysR family regulator